LISFARHSEITERTFKIMLSREDRLDRFRQIDLYPVISDEFTDGRGSLATLREIAAGGAKIVQLREKALPKRALYELALAFRSVCDEHDMLLIIDDEIDVAMAAGADGVHLGQDDLPLGPARLMAPELIIGQSTHSIAEGHRRPRRRSRLRQSRPIFATPPSRSPASLWARR
jgi:thiamine-phosphate pyrophosphorylase